MASLTASATLRQIASVRGAALEEESHSDSRSDAESHSVEQPPRETDHTTDIATLVEAVVQQLMEGSGAEYSSAKNFHELGLDSLDHMELATLVGQRLGLEVDSAKLFTYNTPESLSRFLGRQSGRPRRGLLRSLFSRKSS